MWLESARFPFQPTADEPSIATNTVARYFSPIAKAWRRLLCRQTAGWSGLEESVMRVSRSAQTILAAVLLIGGYSLALAAPPADTTLPSYTELDKDKDGIVTLSEIDVYPPGVAARLQHCDSNKDHKLSQREYAQCTASTHPHTPAK
ncbi:MAG: hypothetical protein ACN6OR_01585 [Stenotrophomonas sp.]